jgi:hypothetical protein
LTGSLQSLLSIALAQPENPQTTAIPLLWVLTRREHLEDYLLLRPALYEPLCIDLFEVGQAQQAHDYDDGNLA